MCHPVERRRLVRRDAPGVYSFGFISGSILLASAGAGLMPCSGHPLGAACDFDIRVLRAIVTVSDAMNLLRLMLSTLVLLVQAWPAYAAIPSSNASEPCAMGCCAAMAEMEMAACGCTEAALPASPANTPPASARDLVPQVSWVQVASIPDFERSQHNSSILPDGGALDREVPAQSHVRLPVLFCSFLN